MRLFKQAATEKCIAWYSLRSDLYRIGEGRAENRRMQAELSRLNIIIYLSELCNQRVLFLCPRETVTFACGLFRSRSKMEARLWTQVLTHIFCIYSPKKSGYANFNRIPSDKGWVHAILILVRYQQLCVLPGLSHRNLFSNFSFLFHGLSPSDILRFPLCDSAQNNLLLAFLLSLGFLWPARKQACTLHKPGLSD